MLAGKYRVERVLGVGGMGMVVAAHHLQLDERVAIKFMLPEAFANPEAVARFTREARAAVKIKSEHVARVSDVGALENGAPYMVMEYLDGSDLSGWLKQYGRLGVEQTVEFLLQAGEAIAEAHALGIVHRDLKPANLFVIRRPSGGYSVKVLDFGISKVTGGNASDLGITKTSATLGSPLYMSPELVGDARAADLRCDIWALGVIAYELLSGVTPFTGDSLFNVLLKIQQTQPVPLRQHAPTVPPGLEAVIAKCLEKDPARRYASVGELAVALAEFGPARARLSLERISGVLGPANDFRGPLPPTTVSSNAPPNATSNPTGASWGKTSSRAASPRRTLLGLSALVGLGLCTASYYALRSPAPQTVSASASAAFPNAPPTTASSSALLAPPAAANELSRAPLTSAIAATPSAPPAVPSASSPAPLAKRPTSSLSNVPAHPAPAKPSDVYDDRK